METVVKRHKTLGAWVPVWVAGPCRNEKCEAYVEEGAAAAEEAHRTRHGRTSAKETGRTSARESHPTPAAETGRTPAEATGEAAVPEAGDTAAKKP